MGASLLSAADDKYFSTASSLCIAPLLTLTRACTYSGDAGSRGQAAGGGRARAPSTTGNLFLLAGAVTGAESRQPARSWWRKEEDEEEEVERLKRTGKRGSSSC